MATVASNTSTTAGYKAYQLLHFAFTLAPIVAGADKFLDRLTEWEKYLSPLIATRIPAHSFMMAVGAIEIIAGLIVLWKPRIGAFIVAAWLLGIIANLLSIPGYYDIALRDFGLCLGACALGYLAFEYDQPRTA